jgi:type II secretory pathway pseudopilin PulG
MVEIDLGNVMGPSWSGRPVLIERQDALENTVSLANTKQDAYRKWSAAFQYVAYDPTFYNGTPYYANPLAIPSIGESPVSHPQKWINPQTEQGELDLTQALGLIGDNAAKIAVLWANAFGGLSSNPFILSFDDVDDIELESGVWNDQLNRLEC